MKKGRKAKAGKRYPCGKRTVGQIQDDMRQTAVEARMRVFGVSKELAGKDVMGSPLGRYLHWKIITPAQADAGYDFAATMRDYLAAAGGQRPSQGKAGFLPGLRSSSDSGLTIHAEPRAKAYMEVLREVDTLDPCSPSATSVVWDVCISENDRSRESELGLLRSGLNALSRVLHRGVMAQRRRPAA